MFPEAAQNSRMTLEKKALGNNRLIFFVQRTGEHALEGRGMEETLSCTRTSCLMTGEGTTETK